MQVNADKIPCHLKKFFVPVQRKLCDCYICRMVGVFREVKRVLRDDGTAWVNMGDSYASGKGTCNNPGGGPKSYIQEKERFPLDRGNKSTLDTQGLKPKDLCLVPARLALALQADGWWVRSDICWAKLAPMPESATDRPTSAWEHIFLLAKSPRYFYDQEAVKQPADFKSVQRMASGYYGNDPVRDANSHYRVGFQRGDGYSCTTSTLRNFWLLSPEPFKDAHFATFPTEIPRRAIRAGTSARGCCPACGAPWVRKTERTDEVDPSARGSRFDQGKTGTNGNDRTQAGERYLKAFTGWSPACSCPQAEPVPCTVLDPFGGSGTTGKVALELGRSCILIELNPDYCEMIQQRTTTTLGLAL